MQAALDLANSGFKVYLVDTAPGIGGTMAQLDKTFPTNDCSMCIMAPKLVDVGRHPNIELVTYSEVEGFEGTPGDFRVRIRRKARYVDPEACTGCGVCARECPIDAINSFNEGMNERRAIYLLYPQAVPLAFAIDRERCIGCGLCENLCLANAIRYDDKDEIVELRVGSVILCPGFEEFDPALKPEYGHGRFPNVVSSIEFERILSASGPFRSHVLRPSDGVQPRRIAWLQCVGSRDLGCGRDYCSSVCCTYAIKEAVIAKEHVPTIEPTIFFMDMRTFGKGFEAYYDRARDEYGVRFLRCRVSRVEEDPETNDLLIRYETEDGHIEEERFDLVVLSVGFTASEGARRLAERVGVELTERGFCAVDGLDPVSTSREGVFVCGSFAGPKDIPETVMEASGAAARASGLIASARDTLVGGKALPAEADVRGDAPRIGVFICHCGINIGGYIDVPGLVAYARGLPNVVHAEDNLYTCSQDTQKRFVETIQEHHLNRVIVASCTPRTHEPLFQSTLREAGLNAHLFEMANIRDQCSWVHMGERASATAKARDLVRMAVSKAQIIEPLSKVRLGVTQSALVVGGGLAGMTAALAIAEQGYDVDIVERDSRLGGNLNHIHTTADGADVQAFLRGLTARVEADGRVRVHTGAAISTIEGYVGNYRTTLDHGGSGTVIEHGVVVVATGAVESVPTEYLCGQDPDVVTQTDLERMLAEGADLSGSTLALIQCVGSREDHRPYCSRICCTNAVKNALRVVERYPDARVFVLYRDMRTYGFNETLYERAREKGVIFVRYDLDRKPVVARTGGGLEVRVRDPILGEDIDISADRVVLSPAIAPPDGNEALGKLLKVPLNSDGFFLEAHVKLRPVDFSTEGVFLAGMAHSPKFIGETIAQAYAAASRACTIISKDHFEAEATVSAVDDAMCVGCGLCVAACPYNAIELKDGHAAVTEALCKGCGLCAATCRSGAIQQKGFKDQQILSLIKGAICEVL
ncbi:MAG: FAD-dependent oxidoreductase [Thermoplasmata archaeon]|nr:FAD-dependent oxidoreductase [Thermoplasmata archaeon]